MHSKHGNERVNVIPIQHILQLWADQMRLVTISGNKTARFALAKSFYLSHWERLLWMKCTLVVACHHSPRTHCLMGCFLCFCDWPSPPLPPQSPLHSQEQRSRYFAKTEVERWNMSGSCQRRGKVMQHYTHWWSHRANRDFRLGVKSLQGRGERWEASLLASNSMCVQQIEDYFFSQLQFMSLAAAH